MSTKFKKKLANIKFIRLLILRILKLFARNLTISHPYSSKPFLLNTYKHKGYWYYGKDREASTMTSFDELISAGDTVIEVGGHIGFISVYFAELVGDEGRIIVFEPGENNLSYTRKNLDPIENIEIVEKGCANTNGQLTFYEDTISGQNNSLREDYDGASGVAITHGESLRKNVRTIEVVRLDDFIRENNLDVNFIKIDVEGAENEVLLGMGEYLGKVPKIMVEISEDHQSVQDLLVKNGYVLWRDNLGEEFGDSDEAIYNVFAILK